MIRAALLSALALSVAWAAKSDAAKPGSGAALTASAAKPKSPPKAGMNLDYKGPTASLKGLHARPPIPSTQLPNCSKMPEAWQDPTFAPAPKEFEEYAAAARCRLTTARESLRPHNALPRCRLTIVSFLRASAQRCTAL